MFSIKKKLYLAFSVVMLITISSSIFAGYSTQRVNERLELLAEYGLPGTASINKIDTMYSDYRIEQYAHITASDPRRMEEMETNLRTLEQQIQQTMAEYEKTMVFEEDKRIFAIVKTQWQNYLTANQKVTQLSKSQKKQEALIALEKRL